MVIWSNLNLQGCKSNSKELKYFFDKCEKNIPNKKYKYNFYLEDSLFSWINLQNDPYKYSVIKNAYNKNSEQLKINYDEYENILDNLLEEFKLFTNNYNFDDNSKKIIDAFVNDPLIKPNIKFADWIDYWIII